MSHLLLRPIYIVTDRPSDDEALFVVEPPSQINAEAWDPPVWICFLGFNHYEVTLAITSRRQASVPPLVSMKTETC